MLTGKLVRLLALCIIRNAIIRQIVNACDLQIEIAPDLALGALGQTPGHPQHEGVIQQRQCLQGVVVTARLGEAVEGSGQSNTSRNSFRPERTHVR